MNKNLIITGMFTLGLVLALSINVFAVDWQAGTWYNIGDQVSYNGDTYQCIQAHTALIGWEPPNVPALWNVVPDPNNNDWIANTPYSVGDEVEYEGLSYRCLQAHTSQIDWIPSQTPALWVTNINSEYSSELIDYVENLYGEGELSEFDIIDVDKSVKVITYDIELQHKITGEIELVTWYKVIQ